MKITLSKALLFLIILFILPIHAQEEPSWVHLKKANNYIEKTEYTKAMNEVRKARQQKIKEEIATYWEYINTHMQELTHYELIKLRNEKEKQLKINDSFAEYHAILGDIYFNTDFLDEAEKEYRKALDTKKDLDYPDRVIEIQYKLAKLYNKKGITHLEEMMYHDILAGLFATYNKDYWNRIRYNIREDLTLGYVFKIYRIDGIKYLNALYKIGVHEAIMQKRDEALFYLSLATVVWMTYYGNEIKGFLPNFQYESPVDFTNYMKNKRFAEYINEDFIIDYLMFYIGYIHHSNKSFETAAHYFTLAKTYSHFSGRHIMIRDLISYLESHPDHLITYEEILQ